MFLRYFPRLCVQRWWHCCAPFLQKAQEAGWGDYGDVAFHGALAIYRMVDSHPACKPLFLAAGAEEALRAIRASTATSGDAKMYAGNALTQLGLRV